MAVLAFTFISNAKVNHDKTASDHENSEVCIEDTATEESVELRELFEAAVSSCTSVLNAGNNNCSNDWAFIIPQPSGATSYSWSVSPGAFYSDQGSWLHFTNLDPAVTYTVSVTITGGVCDGTTLSATFQCNTTGGLLP